MTVRHLKIFQVIFILVLNAQNKENICTLNSLSKEHNIVKIANKDEVNASNMLREMAY